MLFDLCEQVESFSPPPPKRKLYMFAHSKHTRAQKKLSGGEGCFWLDPKHPHALHVPHLTDSHSKPWAPVWNQHWACRKWEISTGDSGGRQGGGGDKRKTAERTIDLTFDIGKSTFHVTVPSFSFISSFPLLSISLSASPPTSACCVRACNCACVYTASLKRSLPWKALGLLFFPGTVIRSAKPRKWTSGKLFQQGLVFVVPHSKTTWPHATPVLPPSPLNYSRLENGKVFKVWEAHDAVIPQYTGLWWVCALLRLLESTEVQQERPLEEALSRMRRAGPRGCFDLTFSAYTRVCRQMCLRLCAQISET